MSRDLASLRGTTLYLEAGDADDGSLGLAARQGADGAMYVPAFTTRDGLERFADGGRSASVPASEIAAVWPEELLLVIDPGADTELVLAGHEVRALASAHRVEEVPAGTSVMLGEPAEEPVDALAAAAAECGRHPEIAAAHRAQIYVDRPGETPQIVIGLRLDTTVQDEEALFGAVSDAFADAGGGPVSIVVMPGAGVAAWLQERTGPFYTRDGVLSDPALHPNAALVDALARATVERTEEASRELFVRLAEAQLLVPVLGTDEQGVTLAVREGEDGGATFNAFTSEAAVRRIVPEGLRCLPLPMNDLARIALERPGAAVLVDPGSPAGVALGPEDLVRLR